MHGISTQQLASHISLPNININIEHSQGPGGMREVSALGAGEVFPSCCWYGGCCAAAAAGAAAAAATAAAVAATAAEAAREGLIGLGGGM